MKRQRQTILQPESSRIRRSADTAFWLTEEQHRGGTHIVRHSHSDFVQLIFIVAGCASFYFDDRLIIGAQGHAVFIPRHTAHWIDVPRQTALRTLSLFSDGEIEGFNQSPGQLAVTPLLDALSVAVSAMPQRQALNPAQQRLYQVFIDQLNSAVLQDSSVPFPDDARLRQAIYLLTSSENFSIKLAGLSRKIGIGERTLTRLFIAKTGMTFSEYKKTIQMDYAATLLGSGLSVLEVALQIGYETQSGFIYAFRQQRGISPLQYKKRLRQAAAK